MAAGTLTEQAVETVADHIEDVAEVTRQVNQHVLRYFFGGVGLGGVLGFLSGYRFTKEKIRSKVLKEAEEEIEQVREHYRRKAVALANEEDKDKVELEDVIRKQRYRDDEDAIEESPEHVFHPPQAGDTSSGPARRVMAQEERQQRRQIEEPPEEEGTSKSADWSYPAELDQRVRNPHLPYIIHQDEFSQGLDGYSKVSYTYYEPDDVLVDEDNKKLNPVTTVGVENLKRFGHGSDDFDVVYIRNNSLNLEIEVTRITDQSFEEHVLGLDRDDIQQ